MPKHRSAQRATLPRPDILDAFEPALTRLRRDGWTPERQRAFIDALAETGCVTDACRSVGMSTQSAYALRRVFEAQAFRLAWDTALDYAIRRLSDQVMSRAIHGVVVPHYYKGELIGEHRRYNDRLAMFLLRYRAPVRYGKHLDTIDYGRPDEFFAVHLARMALEVECGTEKMLYTPDEVEAERAEAERIARGGREEDEAENDTW